MVHILRRPWKRFKILTYVKVQQTPNPAAQFPSVVPPTKQRKIKSTAMDIWLHMVTKKAL